MSISLSRVNDSSQDTDQSTRCRPFLVPFNKCVKGAEISANPGRWLRKKLAIPKKDLT